MSSSSSASFTMPVHWYCSAPVHTVPGDIDLNTLHHRFIKLGVSSLPVVDDAGGMQGLVSRTDLLAAAFIKHPDKPDTPLLTIPESSVLEIMAVEVLSVDHEDTVSAAAKVMVDNQVHRVVVTKEGTIAGVLSARDVLPAVLDLRLANAVGEFMSTPLFVIAGDEPLETAMLMLQQARVSGVVVLGDSGAEGVFTQAEALLCRNLPRNAMVRDAMDTSIITIHTETPLYLAAEQAVSSKSKRVVVTDHDGVRGMVTAFDFVRAAV